MCTTTKGYKQTSKETQGALLIREGSQTLNDWKKYMFRVSRTWEQTNNILDGRDPWHYQVFDVFLHFCYHASIKLQISNLKHCKGFACTTTRGYKNQANTCFFYDQPRLPNYDYLKFIRSWFQDPMEGHNFTRG